MFNNYPDILTPKEAAKALCISVNSIYRLIREHSLGCKRIGRKIIIPKLSLMQYVRSAQYTVNV